MAMFVIKRDNSLESFNTGKIKAGILKSGASKELATRIAEDVEKDISRIAACSIRDKVIRRLMLESRDVAATFEAYKKSSK